MRWNSFAGAALGLAILAGAACQRTGSVERGMESARVKAAAGDFTGAVRELDSVLAKQGGNPEALVLLAQLELKLGNPAAAQIYARRAGAAGADAGVMRHLKADELMAMGKFEELVALLKDPQTASDARLLALRASAEVGLDDLDAAEKTLASARALAADDVAVLLAMARLQMAKGAPGEALTLVDRVLKQDARAADAWLLRGRLSMQLGRFAEASTAYGRVADQATGPVSIPQEVESLTGLAESHMAQNDLPAAAKVVKRLRERYPNSLPAHALQGRLALLSGDGETAVGEFTLLSNSQPDNLEIKSLLGASLMMQGSREQALAVLNEVLARNPTDLRTRRLLAQVLLMADRPDEARSTLVGSSGLQPSDAQGEWLLAMSLVRLGDMKNGIALLEKRAAAAPKDKTIQAELVRAYLADSRYREARELLDRLPSEAKDASLAPLEIMARIEGRSGAEALRQLESLVAAHPDDAGLLVISGAYALNLSDLPAARRYFSKALQRDPEGIGARMGLASLSARAGDYRSASALLKEVLQRDDKQTHAMLALAGLALREGRGSEATLWLERTISADPGNVDARLNLAQVSYAAGNPAKAKSMLNQAVAVATDKAPATNAAGETALIAGQNAEALELFRAAGKLGYKAAQLNVARALMALGRHEEALPLLESVKEPAYLNQARLLLVEVDALTGQVDRARRRVQELQASGLTKAGALELNGDVSRAARQMQSAAGYYAQAFRAAPARNLAIKSFQAQQAAGQPHAEQSLRAWLKQDPSDNQVRTLLATHLLETGDARAAIVEFETAVKSLPSPDAQLLNNLASAYAMTGDARALDTARQAYELDGRSGSIADTYGWLLVQAGEADKGRRMLKQAVDLDRDNRTAQFHFAAASLRSGDRQAALETLEALLSGKQAFSERDEARRLLDSLRQR